VDRLDYTKGIDVRIRAFTEALIEELLDPEDVTMLQLAIPSRQNVDQYRKIRDDVELLVGRANGDLGRVGDPAIHYLHQSVPREELVAMYVAADVLLVTPLRDGMNLVAKEYIAAQDPQDPGVLVLSRFAGAARQLRTALLVNPHDPDELAEALDRALTMPLVERQDRWRSSWAAIERVSPAQWGKSFVDALVESTLPRTPAPKPLALVPRHWPAPVRSGDALAS
jgi:trehalose 6-phosphate synthase